VPAATGKVSVPVKLVTGAATLNVAVTQRACVIATVHVVPLVLVHPVHAPSWYPLAATAVSVTVPLSPASLQSHVPPVPQLIPVPVIRPFQGHGEIVSV
jgi:hypothetical protein